MIDFLLECQRCNYEWIRRAPDRPKRCPRCSNRNWEKVKKVGETPTKEENKDPEKWYTEKWGDD